MLASTMSDSKYRHSEAMIVVTGFSADDSLLSCLVHFYRVLDQPHTITLIALITIKNQFRY